MRESDVLRFLNSIDGVDKTSEAELIQLFAYYLTVELGEPYATPKQVNRCFLACDLQPPHNTQEFMYGGSHYAPRKFVEVGRIFYNRYRLDLWNYERMSKQMGTRKVAIQTSVTLRSLEHTVPEGLQRQFLKETIDCFEVGANRAAIVMCWMLVMDHLCDYVFKNHLIAFNAALQNANLRRLTVVNSRDDFSDIPEGRFIELLRTAGIITNDLRKILDEKLGTRNSAAHPSNVIVRQNKTIEFIEDLVENVLVKFKL